ncbi:ubiquitin-like domain-containing CTD phosphatase 1 [Pyrus ussuriensis x Pyrus communis]|uniref:Ubiquitin-like domain-containing CTD phosphatase 1 n=1 Tax=Pyrus ussuriensis x Pyrus communis TaxID=2448454 RepID=A0A5N5FZB8_9ROSA|nr:ubiquitin-like domain-containing CTD phosphatase 1 [Pyrus ussuriensis x Pyrus communis]
MKPIVDLLSLGSPAQSHKVCNLEDQLCQLTPLYILIERQISHQKYIESVALRSSSKLPNPSCQIPLAAISSCIADCHSGIFAAALNVFGSSCGEKNVDGVLDCIMGKLRRRLAFVWDQHECTDSGLKSLENKNKPLFFKELDKVWSYFSGKYSESDTLSIDDKPYKALLNPPNTGIFFFFFFFSNNRKKKKGPNLDGSVAVCNNVMAVSRMCLCFLSANPFCSGVYGQDF